MPKDWVGGKASVFKTMGATGHADHDRQKEDYYATEPLKVPEIEFSHDQWIKGSSISEELANNVSSVKESKGCGIVAVDENGVKHGELLTPVKWSEEAEEELCKSYMLKTLNLISEVYSRKSLEKEDKERLFEVLCMLREIAIRKLAMPLMIIPK